MRVRRTPHDILLKLFAVLFSKTSAALLGPPLLTVPPQAISRIRPPAYRAAATRFAGTPLLIVPPRDASRACHSDASCNATEPTLLIAPYQGLSWCYVQVVVPMRH